MREKRPEEDPMKKIKFFASTALLPAILAFAFPLTAGRGQSKIEVKTIQAFPYCCIHHKGPFTEIQNVITQLNSSLQSQNIRPAGPMVGVYYNTPENTDPQDLEWDIGFPCDSHVSPLQPLQKKIWNFAQVASVLHTGSYESTGETYLLISEWMEANGMEQAGPVLEKYLTMPTPDTKPENMQTEIWVPFKVK
jgi:effector-binding domain-containing protein